ncbi:hypothetical protein KIN20_031991 [Parelaphostrongylus tenuis]|uniref:Uncharacterized protein n=1 Tax=Parelaphostrongylus tenuis TaxID=148309 RepID=A0AAD5WHE4_PARTN|nr:hypothetical protein KIN20_031991 [Parelaphostrongylus tenuis]
MDTKLSEMASEETVKKSRSGRKSRRRRRNTRMDNDEYTETIREAKKLKEKFSSRRRVKDDDMAFLKIGASENGAPKIQNSESHNNLLKRAEEAQINRTFQIELRADALQTLWMCALCHQRSAQDELGDLFGPYYVNIRCEGHWPNFLLKKSLKLTKGETYCIDVWFHGDCLLWSPDIQMKGNQFTHLEEKLHQFWKQVNYEFLLLNRT